MSSSTTTTPYAAGTPVIGREGKIRGQLTGGSRRCRLESCGGARLATRWEDGSLTYPCSKGMTWQGNTWRIQ